MVNGRDWVLDPARPQFPSASQNPERNRSNTHNTTTFERGGPSFRLAPPIPPSADGPYLTKPATSPPCPIYARGYPLAGYPNTPIVSGSG
jgi:hypothetical protein